MRRPSRDAWEPSGADGLVEPAGLDREEVGACSSRSSGPSSCGEPPSVLRPDGWLVLGRLPPSGVQLAAELDLPDDLVLGAFVVSLVFRSWSGRLAGDGHAQGSLRSVTRHDGGMSEEIDLASKATGEVVAALAEESGALAIPREYANYIAARIHLRHYPALVERATSVAEKLQELGLPRRAFAALDEPLLTAILEGMAEETDSNLQEAWENLLANELVDDAADVRRGFPNILRSLGPTEVLILNELGSMSFAGESPRAGGHDPLLDSAHALRLNHGLPLEGLREIVDRDDREIAIDHLMGLGLIGMDGLVYAEDPNERSKLSVFLTQLGWRFVEACRAPISPD
jgi:hypothetical protein